MGMFMPYRMPPLATPSFNPYFNRINPYQFQNFTKTVSPWNFFTFWNIANVAKDLSLEIGHSLNERIQTPIEKPKAESSGSPTTSKSFSIDSILQKNKTEDSTETKNSDDTSASSIVSETMEAGSREMDKAHSPVQSAPSQAPPILPNPMLQPQLQTPNPLYTNPLLLESLAIRQRLIQNQLLQRNFDAQMRLINSGMYPGQGVHPSLHSSLPPQATTKLTDWNLQKLLHLTKIRVTLGGEGGWQHPL